MKIEGIQSLQQKLKKAKRDAAVQHSVIVGYTAYYAIYVHENVGVEFKVGQAKFLEEPARYQQDGMRRVFNQVLKGGGTVEQALMMAGLYLQRESQLLCPVDTGNLRASAFTRPDDK